MRQTYAGIELAGSIRVEPQAKPSGIDREEIDESRVVVTAIGASVPEDDIRGVGLVSEVDVQVVGGGLRAGLGADRKAIYSNSGFTFQISSAYSRIVRSDENAPMPATFMMAWRVHSVGRR